jgi:glycosyltransferase involved in cell wall biosynthesis
MPKVLYLWQAGYPWDVRTEKVCLTLLRNNWDVTILARWKPGQPQEEDCQGLRVVRVGYKLPGSLSLPVPLNPLWSSMIQRMARRLKPDLVIAREIMLAETASRLCRRQRIPIVMDMAEHYPAAMRTFKKYRENVAYRFLVFRARVPDHVERRSLDWADGVITVCPEQCRRLTTEFRYPSSRMAVVENTPDLDRFPRVRIGPSDPPLVFAYHGAMTPQRGLDNLLRGFAMVVPENSNLRLLLAGHGESYEDLVRLAQELKIDQHVTFTGKYRFEDLPRLYGETDVGLIPFPLDDSWQHSLPNKLYDYLACGKPVIVTPTRPLRRVVEETKTGIVLEDQSPESIAQGLRSIQSIDLQSFSRNGLRASRERYNWDHDAHVMMEFLESYVSRPSRPFRRPLKLA